ncbi:MAG TPA: TIR domain-containing protein [Chitinophagaceae bacterium]|nr:TIR domain-containing protein [Chitinophagaceae bacterium]
MNLDTVIDDLSKKYASKNLIPVLGCELFKVNNGSKESINIHEHIIKESFYPSEQWPEPPTLLSELPFAVQEFDYNSLLGCYNMLEEDQKKLTLLKQLANLQDFQIFLMASVFKDFEKEFRKSNGDDVEVYKNDTISIHGLPAIDFGNKKRKIIYLFDNIDSHLCALTDEQRLESMYSLANSSKSNQEHSLLSYLRDNKTLLFIGCDFPDWFMRYCIRVLSNTPFSGRPIYIVNDHPTKLSYQEFFFAKHNIKLIQTSPVDSFIEKFCKKASRIEQFKNRYTNSQVFISYSKKHDYNIAKSLSYNFRDQGVEAYFDEESKEIGSHESKIKDSILNNKTKALICVISKNLAESIFNNEYSYIRDVEWDSAHMRNKIATNSPINQKINIVPYFVDDERDYLSKLPQYILSEFRFGELHGGFEKLFQETKKVLA